MDRLIERVIEGGRARLLAGVRLVIWLALGLFLACLIVNGGQR